MNILKTLLEISLILCLFYVIYKDIRTFLITNRTNLLILVITTVYVLSHSSNILILTQFLFAVAAFAIFYAFFYFHWLGGGDVKLLSLACFWIGPSTLLSFATFLLITTVIYWVGAKWRYLPFQTINGFMKIPFGPSVAGAWILTIITARPG